MNRRAAIEFAADENNFRGSWVNVQVITVIAGYRYPRFANDLQVDGHPQQVAATALRIANQAFQFLIGFFSYALVLHADVQPERAGCFTIFASLNNPDQESERLHHAADAADGVLMLMDVKRIADHLPLDAFRPAVHRKRPSQIGQKIHPAGGRVP